MGKNRNAGMRIKNCKKRGEWAELCFAVRALREGLRLARPWESRRDTIGWYIRRAGEWCGCR